MLERHRVSVARQLGLDKIDAYVTEVVTEVGASLANVRVHQDEQASEAAGAERRAKPIRSLRFAGADRPGRPTRPRLAPGLARRG